MLRPGSALTVLFCLFFTGSALAGDPGDFESPLSDASVPCLTEAQRSEIWRELEASRRQLAATGMLPLMAEPVTLAFGWPLQPASGFDDPGYHSISNYVDHDPMAGLLRDYSCGSRTYDLPSGYNHAGTDFYIWPFPWYKMDHGHVEIVAVADGVILSRTDGNFDRNCALGSGNWNAVYVQHADGSVAWYGHMKNGSLTSKLVGESVVRGEVLGTVGSSGNSSGPHLHLEVYDSSGMLIDPFAGPCNSLNATSWWEDQRPYDDSAVNHFRVHGRLPVTPPCGTQEILDIRDSFVEGDTLHAMIYFREVRAGQPVHLELRDPSNALMFYVDFNWTADAPRRTYNSRYIVADYDPLGTWRYVLQYAGNTYEAPFEVRSLPYADATAAPMAGVGGSQDVSWVDFDGDGDQDVFVVADGQPNRLFRNDAGTWTDATPAALAVAGSGRGAAWADFDNDGDPDVYVVKYNGANQLVRNDGGGVFTDVTPAALADIGPGQCARWADVDSDGWVDLYLVNSGQANRLFLNPGGLGFVDGTAAPLDNAALAYDAAFGDYDDDGDPDLYLGVYGANRLFRNEGGGTFTDATTPPLDDGGIGYAVAWADVDGDLDLDLYLGNYFGANRLLRNDGGGVFTDATVGPLGDASNTTSVAFGDYDNDGDLDLHVANSGAANRLLRNDGGFWSDATTPPLGDARNAQSAAMGDADGDGDLEIFVANYAGGNALFDNVAGAVGHSWVGVRLRGILSNRSGIGARVRAYSAGGVQERVLGSQAGSAQGPMELHFGLANEVAVDSLVVDWPSGIAQTVAGVTPNAVVDIVEAVGTAAPSASVLARLDAASPNPFNPSTTIGFRLEREGVATLTVYDVAGRMVRTLHDGWSAAGEQSVQWDGLDRSGRRVASGVYIYRLKTATFEASRRMMLLK